MHIMRIFLPTSIMSSPVCRAVYYSMTVINGPGMTDELRLPLRQVSACVDQ